jgi:hypothetical protein
MFVNYVYECGIHLIWFATNSSKLQQANDYRSEDSMNKPVDWNALGQQKFFLFDRNDTIYEIKCGMRLITNAMCKQLNSKLYRFFHKRIF